MAAGWPGTWRWLLAAALAGPASGLLVLRKPVDYSVGYEGSVNDTCPMQQEWPAQLTRAPTDRSACKTFLEAPQGCQMAGLGHAFMSFNALVTFAARTNLTLRTWFQTNSHGMDRLQCRKYFFGNSLWAGARVLKNCNVYAFAPNDTVLEDMENQVKEINDNCGSYDNKCFVFRLTGALAPNETGINIAEYRKVFEAQAPGRRNRTLRKGGRVRIAVHIRRGDLLDYVYGDKQKAEMRLIPNTPYVSLLQKLVHYFHGENATSDVTLHCQGARGNMCPDIDGKTYDDFSKVLAKEGRLLMGPDGVFDALEDLCDADVVITSKSGFSHLAAILCRKPIFLTVPFWHSYACVANALPLKPTYALTMASWRQNLTLPSDFGFDEEAFRSLLGKQAAAIP